MAKNNNYYGNRRKSGGGKIWGGLIAFTLTAAIVASVLGVGTGGFKDWSFTKGFGRAPEQQQEETGGGSVITDTTTSGGMSLMTTSISPEDFGAYGVSPAAETAYTITATAQPAAALPEIDWSIAWQNPASAWATGNTVSDFVTYAVSEDTTQATVSCSQAFGEPIIITATSAYNTAAKATCQVDYLSAITIENYMGELNNENGDAHMVNVDGDCESNIGVTINYGIGTLKGDVSMNSVYSYNSGTTNNKLNNRYLEHFENQNPTLEFGWSGDTLFNYQAKYLINETATSRTYTFEIMPSRSYADESLAYSNTSRDKVNAVEYLEYAVKYAAMDEGATAYFDFNIIYTYNNTTVSNVGGSSEKLPLSAYAYNLPTTNDVTLNNGNIVFLPK